MINDIDTEKSMRQLVQCRTVVTMRRLASPGFHPPNISLMSANRDH